MSKPGFLDVALTPVSSGGAPSPMRAACRTVALPAVVTYLPFLAIHALCITGCGWSIRGAEVFCLLPLFALPVCVFSLFGLPSRNTRPWATRLAMTGGLLVVLFVPVVRLAAALRIYGFLLAAERAQPLIEAIERYRNERGAPPPTLAALVPQYLPAIPDSLPPLQIECSADTAPMYCGNEWVLTAEVPTGVLNFDVFLYFPNQRYPDRGYGGWLERIGAWAYVHE